VRPKSYTDAIHALCAGHHLRELLGAEEAGQAWASGMSCLLLDTKELVDDAKTAGLDALTDQALGDLDACYRAVIKAGYEQNPGLAENAAQRIKRTDAQNLLLRLDREQADALRFAHDFRVPFGNNLAEVCHERRRRIGCRRSDQLMRCCIGDGGAGLLGWWSSVVAL